jgi:hypothetical protein
MLDSDTATVFADGLRPGKHKLNALRVDNQRAPLIPEVASTITVNVRHGYRVVTILVIRDLWHP